MWTVTGVLEPFQPDRIEPGSGALDHVNAMASPPSGRPDVPPALFVAVNPLAPNAVCRVVVLAFPEPSVAAALGVHTCSAKLVLVRTLPATSIAPSVIAAIPPLRVIVEPEKFAVLVETT